MQLYTYKSLQSIGTSFRTILDFYKTCESRPFCDLCLVSPVIVICMDLLDILFEQRTHQPTTQLFRNCAIRAVRNFSWFTRSQGGSKSPIFLGQCCFWLKLLCNFYQIVAILHITEHCVDNQWCRPFPKTYRLLFVIFHVCHLIYNSLLIT